MINKLPDLYNAEAFRQLFHIEYSATWVLFLNAFLPDLGSPIVDIREFNFYPFYAIPEEHLGEGFVVVAKDKTGEEMMVELQFCHTHPDLKECVLSAASPFSMLRRKSGHPELRVFMILIVPYGVEGGKGTLFVKHYPFEEDGDVTFLFIQTSEFNKTAAELEDEKDVWLWLFNNPGTDLETLGWLGKWKMENVLRQLDMSTWWKEDIKSYEEYPKTLPEKLNEIRKKDNDLKEGQEWVVKPPDCRIKLNFDDFEKLFAKPLGRKIPIDPSEIVLGSLEGKLQGIAFNLFREWTQNCLAEYPDLNLTIIDEGELVENLKSCLQSAISSWLNEEDRVFILPWDVGYVRGHVQGQLNVLWVQNYIIRQGEDFKFFAALTSVLNYLEFDTVTKVRIEKLYQELLKKDINLAEVSEEVDELELNPEKYKTEIKTGEKGGFMTVLYNQRFRQVRKITDSVEVAFLPELREYVDYEELRGVMRLNMELVS